MTVNFIDDDVSMVVDGSGVSQSFRFINRQDAANPPSVAARISKIREQSIALSGDSTHPAEFRERRAITPTSPRSRTAVEIAPNELAKLRLNLTTATHRLARTETELVTAQEALSRLQERVDVIPQREAELEQMRRRLYAKEAEILHRERHLNDLINEQKRRLGMMFTHLAEGGQP
jgi:septal ring factor EnvC (AmiA/AmiB activator)